MFFEVTNDNLLLKLRRIPTDFAITTNSGHYPCHLAIAARLIPPIFEEFSKNPCIKEFHIEVDDFHNFFHSISAFLNGLSATVNTENLEFVHNIAKQYKISTLYDITSKMIIENDNIQIKHLYNMICSMSLEQVPQIANEILLSTSFVRKKENGIILLLCIFKKCIDNNPAIIPLVSELCVELTCGFDVIPSLKNELRRFMHSHVNKSPSLDAFFNECLQKVFNVNDLVNENNGKNGSKANNDIYKSLMAELDFEKMEFIYGKTIQINLTVDILRDCLINIEPNFSIKTMSGVPYKCHRFVAVLLLSEVAKLIQNSAFYDSIELNNIEDNQFVDPNNQVSIYQFEIINRFLNTLQIEINEKNYAYVKYAAEQLGIDFLKNCISSFEVEYPNNKSLSSPSSVSQKSQQNIQNQQLQNQQLQNQQLQNQQLQNQQLQNQQLQNQQPEVVLKLNQQNEQKIKNDSKILQYQNNHNFLKTPKKKTNESGDTVGNAFITMNPNQINNENKESFQQNYQRFESAINDQIIFLENQLACISDQNFEETITALCNFNWKKVNLITVFVKTIFSIAETHPRKSAYFIEIIKKISKEIIHYESDAPSTSNNNSGIDNGSKNILLAQIVEEAKLSIHKKEWRLFFIYKCIESSLFTINDIVSSISNSKISGVLQWFAPEIDEKSTMLNSHQKIISLFCSKSPQLTKDNFAILKKLRKKAENPNVLAQKIRQDDLSLFNEGAFTVNYQLPSCVYEKDDIINHKPTLLCYAAFQGSKKVFFGLIKRKANIFICDERNNFLPEFAIAGGCSEIIIFCCCSNNKDMIKNRIKIFQKYAYCDEKEKEGGKGEIDENYFSFEFSFENTLSTLASFFMNDFFEFSLCKDFNNYLKISFTNALNTASRCGNLFVIQKIFEIIIKPAVDNNQESSLMEVSSFNSLACYFNSFSFQQRVSFLEDINSNTLINSVIGGNPKIIKYLISIFNIYNFDLNRKNEDGNSALIVAVLMKDLNSIRRILNSKNVDIVVRDKNGQNLLHIAVSAGDINTALYLMSTDLFNLDDLNYKNHSALLIAAKNNYQSLCLDILKFYLFKNSKNYDIKNVDPKNVHNLLKNLSLIDESEECDTIVYASKHNMLEVIDFIVKNVFLYLREKKIPIKYSLSKRDKNGKTALRYAIENNSLAIIKLLLVTHAIDIKKENNDVVFNSILYGSISVLRLIQSYGFVFNFRDINGMTPLIFATSNNSSEVVRYLCFETKEKIDLHARNKDGEDALEIALRNKYYSIAAFLNSAQLK